MSLEYGPLAAFYDRLTEDVPYEEFAAYYESVFTADGGEFSLILDFCCGTGTLTCLMAQRGYDMIGSDGSEDMLSRAADNAARAGVSPLFLCQDAASLDLYGTVDAAVSSLDSINYISPADLKKALARLRLFIRPGGLFIFDVRSEKWLRTLDGQTSIDEDDDLFCVWRSDAGEENGEEFIEYGIDMFSRRGRMWARSSEAHREYIYSEDYLRTYLTSAGFGDIRFDYTGPQGEFGRLFVVCRRT